MKTKFIVLLLGSILPALVIPGYGPFSPTDRVRAVVLVAGQPLKSTDEATDEYGVTMTVNQMARVVLKRLAEDKGATLNLMLGKDLPPLNWKVASEGAPIVTGVYSVCLNEDDTPDLIVTLSYMGCGLMADNTQLVFLLSDAKGYQMRSAETYDWDSGDIVDYYRDGRVQWVQTLLEQPEDAAGRTQSYWVHHLWAFRGTELRHDKELARVRYRQIK